MRAAGGAGTIALSGFPATGYGDRRTNGIRQIIRNCVRCVGPGRRHTLDIRSFPRPHWQSRLQRCSVRMYPIAPDSRLCLLKPRKPVPWSARQPQSRRISPSPAEAVAPLSGRRAPICLPKTSTDLLLATWRTKVFDLLVAAEKIDRQTVEEMRSWAHSGFSVDNSVYLSPGDTFGLERLAQYIFRVPSVCPASSA